jgi:Cdc6-like AAA superfamily ATPase
MSLLKQLICPTDEIADEIEQLHVRGEKPDIMTCKQLLTFYSKKRESVFAIFDALDARGHESRKEIVQLFDLFSHLQLNRCRLLISSRPHWRSQDLQNPLSEIQILEVKAEASDLENYIRARLKQVGNRNAKLESECLQLINRMNGM